MSHRQLALSGFFALCVFGFASGVVRAQDEPQQPETPPIDQSEPKPAARSPFPVIDPNSQDNTQDQGDMRADFTPLTGVQNPSLGSPGTRHSYWVPGFQFGSSIESVPNSGSNGSSWYAENYFLGNLSLVKVWGRSDLTVNYTGGGFLSSGSQQYSGVQSGFQNFQQLALAQNFHTRRWLFQILDYFSFLPQGSFGFGAGTNLGTPGIGGSLGAPIPGLSNSAIPQQSTFFTGPVYTNAGVLQATYTLTPRSSVTVSGVYTIQRFSNPGNFDNDMSYGSVGYNYTLTSRDNIGAFYSFSSYHYQGLSQAYGNHTFNLAYNRKITGRLALALSAGPQITTYRIPIGTSTGQTSFNLNAYLTYGTEHRSFSGNYTHGFASGSGLYSGANYDQVSANANRRLSRAWNGNLNFGYARNASLSGSGLLFSSNTDNWFGGGGVARPFGRYIDFGLAYVAYITKFNSSSAGNNTSTTNTTNTINISLQWHMRPMVLD